jgi:hypothetical protein
MRAYFRLLTLCIMLCSCANTTEGDEVKFAKSFAAYEEYLNPKSLACSYINNCIQSKNAEAIANISSDILRLHVYISATIMNKCYSLISDKLAASIIQLPENDLDCALSEIQKVAEFDIKRFIGVNLEEAKIPREYYKMALAADDLYKKYGNSSGKKSKPVLFGQELGKSSMAQLVFVLVVLVALAIVFVFLMKKSVSSKASKKAKKGKKEK